MKKKKPPYVKLALLTLAVALVVAIAYALWPKPVEIPPHLPPDTPKSEYENA